MSDSTTPPKGNQKLSGPLQKLNPVCISGMLRVGGRLRRAPIEFETRHPVILPPNSHVTRLLIEQQHRNIGHCGMSLTWTSLRQTFWIIRGPVTVRKVLSQRLLCKRRNATTGKQHMADLPADRVTFSYPLFCFIGIDYFGQFYVKQGWSTVKRYGCVFTCLSMRAVHIEPSYLLSTDTFINSLRRFVGRRGKPISIWSDNGTNLVGGHQELKRCLQELNQSRVNEHLRQRQITWNFNPPQASHMGGVWERVIQAIRQVLCVLISNQTLTDDSLLTFYAEAEFIVNSRPLMPIMLDTRGEGPLTPYHLLMLRLPADHSTGIFTKEDNYVWKRWRHVQYLVEQFWLRWGLELLQILQTRSKWQQPQTNFKVEDIVLLLDDSAPRGKWPLGRVLDTYPDNLGIARQVLVHTRGNMLLRRPITKLGCFLPNKS